MMRVCMSDRPPKARSFYVNLASAPSQAVSRQLQELTRALIAASLPGLSDVVPGYTNVMLEYDADLTSEERLRKAVDNLQPSQLETPAKLVSVPVRYDGPDLHPAAAALRLTPAELIHRHSAPEYLVHTVGFTPGFPYMGLLEPGLRLPRLERPRASVPANSVAIAGSQTGIYPLESPGGWHLLGMALRPVYRPTGEQPFLLEPGDRVRFEPADGPDPDRPSVLELLPEEPKQPFLKVLQPGMLDLVVDAGRLKVGRYGLARSGPLDFRSARIANHLLGNAPFAPVLELNVAGPTLEVVRDGLIAFAGWGVDLHVGTRKLEPFTCHAVRAGEVLRFPAQGRGVRGYLAVAGGFEVGRHIDSASADIRGFVGRSLRAGDLLGTAHAHGGLPGRSFVPYWHPDRPVHIRLLQGPQFNSDAAAALTEGTFHVSSGNRMGIQLDGPPVPGGQVISEGSPLGAVQVTPGGQPIILMNDRGTLGGYAKPAIVHPDDLPRLAQLRARQRVRFRF